MFTSDIWLGPARLPTQLNSFSKTDFKTYSSYDPFQDSVLVRESFCRDHYDLSCIQTIFFLFHQGNLPYRFQGI